MKKYDIKFSGLNFGEHEYDYQIDNQFFEIFDEEEPLNANLKLKLILEKQEKMLVLKFNIKGEIFLKCDRCNDEIIRTLDIEEVLYVKFGHHAGEEDVDVVIIEEKEYEINIAQFVYEYVMVAIPLKNVHKDGECNPKNLEYLEQHEIHIEQEIDPRWNALKEIKIKD